jgi:hypothetical protein
MGYHLATATLGPLLLLQGRHVRRVTPRLAEAAGPRDGTAGDGPPLRLLIAGDSAAAGVGVPVQGRALSGQLVAALAATHRVSWRLIARTGWTTRDLLVQIEAEPAARFDIAVTSLGVNETTGGVPPARWLRDQAALVALLSHTSASRTCSCPRCRPWGAFPRFRSRCAGILGCARGGSIRRSRTGRHRATIASICRSRFHSSPAWRRRTASTRAKPPARCGQRRSLRRSGAGSRI